MWQAEDVPTAMVVVDVLYTWGDWQTLMGLYEETPAPEVRSEIAWALAELGTPQAAAIVEEQIRESWNPLWTASGWPFPRLVAGKEYLSDPTTIDTIRTAEAAWSYFHPEFVLQSNDLLTPSVLRPKVLDDERHSVLKGLAADPDIHPGMRFDLIGSDYRMDDWVGSSMEEAAAEVLQAYPTVSTVRTIASQTSEDLTVDLCGQLLSDESLRNLLLGLLSSGDGYYLPVIEGLLWEVWPARYVQTQGQSMLFREPGGLAAAVDYFCVRYARTYRGFAENSLQRVVGDDSLPAGYRAFLLIYWPNAYQRFSREFVEALLEEDMPDYIKEALRRRLAEWS
jgi:hypothetical protein